MFTPSSLLSGGFVGVGYVTEPLDALTGVGIPNAPQEGSRPSLSLPTLAGGVTGYDSVSMPSVLPLSTPGLANESGDPSDRLTDLTTSEAPNLPDVTEADGGSLDAPVLPTADSDFATPGDSEPTLSSGNSGDAGSKTFMVAAYDSNGPTSGLTVTTLVGPSLIPGDPPPSNLLIPKGQEAAILAELKRSGQPCQRHTDHLFRI